MHTTRSRKRSKSWTPKLLIGLGGIVLVWLVISVSAAYIIRANREVISTEISRIASLPEADRQVALQKLVVATGHDQQASRALADYYISRGDYQLAAEAYLAAQPELRVESAQAYAQAYNFKKTYDLLNIDTSAAKGDDWRALKQRASLNLNPNDLKACDEISTKSAFDTLRDACTILKNQQADTKDIYRLVELGFPLVAASKLESQKATSSTDYILIAQIYARKGDTDKAVSTLEAGFTLIPYDKQVLTEALRTLKQAKKSTEADELQKQIDSNLNILTPQ